MGYHTFLYNNAGRAVSRAYHRGQIPKSCAVIENGRRCCNKVVALCDGRRDLPDVAGKLPKPWDLALHTTCNTPVCRKHVTHRGLGTDVCPAHKTAPLAGVPMPCGHARLDEVVEMSGDVNPASIKGADEPEAIAVKRRCLDCGEEQV